MKPVNESKTTEQPVKSPKKWLLAGIVLLVLGGIAFAMGKRQGVKDQTTTAVHGTEHDGHETAVSQNEGVGIERERLPESNGKREPASAHPEKPEKNSEPEGEDYENEDSDVEVQIAHDQEVIVDHQSAHQSEAKHQPEEPKGFFARIVDTYVDAWDSVNHKVHVLHQSEEENHKLKLENAHLRVMMETQKYGCHIEESKKHAQKVGAKLNAETGTRIGRTLAGVSYQIPENLLPDQLHALGVSYFKSKDYEKSAAIFTFLTEMDGEDEFKNPGNYLMTGVSWYALENYKLADSYFDRVLREAVTKTNQQVQIQAKVWRALVSDRMKNFEQSQKFLQETLENHPHTQEARWINPQEGDRTPASKKSAAVHQSDEDEHIQKNTHH